MVAIRSVCCGVVICEGESHRAAVWTAFQRGISLRYADLTHIYLDGLRIAGIDLSYADLRGANFTNTHMEGANITGALVENTMFTHTDMSNVNYTDCDLTRARLRDTLLQGAFQRRNNMCEGLRWWESSGTMV